VRRGFTKELRQRLGGVSGCAHLGELARAMGPAIVRTSAASRHRQVIADRASADPADAGPAPLPSAAARVGGGRPRRPQDRGGLGPRHRALPVPPIATFT